MHELIPFVGIVFRPLVVFSLILVTGGCFDLTLSEFPDDSFGSTDTSTRDEINGCPDGCLIESICYPTAVTNPQNNCEICSPEISITDWSSNTGESCDDGVFCNGDDVCSERSCSSHLGDPCADDNMFCNGEEYCDETADRCDSKGDPCEGDDICLESDDLCCIPNVPVGPAQCNASNDSVHYDSCEYELLVDDCLENVGTCIDGSCACITGLFGAECNECHFYVRGGLGEYTNHDGGSWDGAVESVQEGIHLARLTIANFEEIDSCSVWVATGTYRPTEDEEGNDSPSDSRTKTIRLYPGVSLYGGFEGTEQTLHERNFEINITTLSGDLEGDDEPNYVNSSENVYRVITGASDSVIDGFVVTAGNATFGAHDDGGGMYNRSGSPIIANCRFQGNQAFDGGGMANAQSNPTIRNCTFEGNRGVDGGAMHNIRSTPIIEGCRFVNNTAENGAGIANTQSNPDLMNCTFRGNSAESGGGINNVKSDPAILNCLFVDNVASVGGGIRNVNSSPMVTNCTFYRNRASVGGGMQNQNGSPEATNCIFWANEATEGAQIQSKNTLPQITYSNVERGCSVENDCTSDDIGNMDADPMFVSSGDLQLACPSPPLDCSPSVDKGHNANLPVDLTTDLSGNPRILDGDQDGTETVDMGAYETQ